MNGDKLEGGVVRCEVDGCDWEAEYINPLDRCGKLGDLDIHEEREHGMGFKL